MVILAASFNNQTNTSLPVPSRTILKLFVLLSVAMGILALSCTRFNAFDQRLREGIIEYNVTFPYLEDENNMMASLLPDKMYLHFSKDKFSSELATVGGLFKNRFVSDQNEMLLIHQMKIFKKKLESDYDQSTMQRQLMNLPNLTIVETNEIDSIAGYACKKAIGIYDHISLPEMIIYYTDDINVESPNWCTQFHPIQGVLMQYEIEQFGIRMRFRANTVQAVEVDPEKLGPEPGYERVSPDQLQVEIEELLNSFNM